MYIHIKFHKKKLALAVNEIFCCTACLKKNSNSLFVFVFVGLLTVSERLLYL